MVVGLLDPYPYIIFQGKSQQRPVGARRDFQIRS
jgi:hypothetical protein